MRLFYFILILLFSVSCQESEKDKIARLVKEWEGKEILFPARSVFTAGNDTVDFAFADSDYKVVTYVDTLGCVSCKLKLSEWKQFMTEVDSLKNCDVSFLFYFYSKTKKELRKIIEGNKFYYPICFDKDDEFNGLNHFPTSMTFQTFLLNKENKVVAIGNPINSFRIKELYLRILNRDKSLSTEPMTTVSLDKKKVDLGTFFKEEKQECSFELTNTGKNVLVIQDIITSCGCTQVKYNKEPLRSGERKSLKVVYEADKAGHFNKTITIYCNVKNSPMQMSIVGNAK